MGSPATPAHKLVALIVTVLIVPFANQATISWEGIVSFAQQQEQGAVYVNHLLFALNVKNYSIFSVVPAIPAAARWLDVLSVLAPPSAFPVTEVTTSVEIHASPVRKYQDASSAAIAPPVLPVQQDITSLTGPALSAL